MFQSIWTRGLNWTSNEIRWKRGRHMKDEHKKKMIAPIVITVLIVLYYVGIACGVIAIRQMPALMAVIMIAGPLALAGAMIYVCIERIKEIRKGEEDDLSQY